MSKVLLYTWFGLLVLCGVIALGFWIGAIWAVEPVAIENCKETAGLFGSLLAGGLGLTFVWFILSD